METSATHESYPMPPRGSRIPRLAFPQGRANKTTNTAALALKNIIKNDWIIRNGLKIITFFLIPALITITCIPIYLINRAQKQGNWDHAGADMCAERINEEGDGFIGNKDFYGLGIRIGLYIQWLASIIANVFLPEERRFMAAAYTSFALALYIALCLLIFQPGCVYTAEIVIVLTILWAGAYIVLIPFAVVTVSVDELETAEVGDETASQFTGLYFLYTIVNITLSPITIWFWLDLAIFGDKGPGFSPTPGEAGTQFFLLDHIRGSDPSLKRAAQFTAFFTIWWALSPALSRVFSRRWLNINAKPFATGRGTTREWIKACIAQLDAGTFFTSMYILFSLGLTFVISVIGTEISKRRGGENRFRRWMGAIETGQRINEWALAILCLLVFVIAIVSTELTLQWNNIQDVDYAADTGQVIPIAVSSFIMLRVIYMLYEVEESHHEKPQDTLPTAENGVQREEAKLLSKTRTSGEVQDDYELQYQAARPDQQKGYGQSQFAVQANEQYQYATRLDEQAQAGYGQSQYAPKPNEQPAWRYQDASAGQRR